jgi:hypothetical protein
MIDHDDIYLDEVEKLNALQEKEKDLLELNREFDSFQNNNIINKKYSFIEGIISRSYSNNDGLQINFIPHLSNDIDNKSDKITNKSNKITNKAEILSENKPDPSCKFSISTSVLPSALATDSSANPWDTLRDSLIEIKQGIYLSIYLIYK